MGILILFDLHVLSNHAWDPRSFILERPDELPVSQTGGVGYDGRFSYALAIHPFGSTYDLDQPAYRYQRILYPMLTRVFGLNQPVLVPWAMLAVNLAATLLSALGLGELLQRRGASPWLSLVYIFSLGFLLTIRLDLLEPLALALALWGWLVYERGRPGLAVVLFALGGLTKEIALVLPLGLALWEGLHRKWWVCLALAVGSFAPYLAWYAFLYLLFGSSTEQALKSLPIWIPFLGFCSLGDPISQGLVVMWVLAPAVLAGLGAAWDLISKWDADEGRLAFVLLAQVALVATLPEPTWVDPLAIIRCGLGLLACTLVWLAVSHPRLLPFAAALWLPSGLVLFLVPGML